MKQVNAVIVGGTMASGKSTLVGGLPFNSVQELDSNDELQCILLEKMYHNDPIAAQMFQLDMILTRAKKYEENSKKDGVYIYDRSIFEDYMFAKQLLENDKYIWEFYKKVWNDLVEQMLNEVGRPLVYILLSCSWEEFGRRIHKRNRKVEVEKFNSNPDHFRVRFDIYNNTMIKIFEKYELEYIIIDTDKYDPLETLEHAKKLLAKKGIL